MVETSVYLLVGKERFLKREFIQGLRLKHFPGGSDAGSNFQEVHPEETSLGPVLDFLRTAPFLAEKRMAVLWEVEALSEEEKDRLLLALKSLPPTAILVLVAEEGTPKKDSFLKELSLKAQNVSCYLPKENQLPAWIASRALKTQGLKIHPEACQFLAERVGEDAAGLLAAIEQLSLLVSPRKEAVLKEASMLFGRPLKRGVFDLLDSLLKKNISMALKIFKGLFEEGTDPSEIVPVLAGQIQRLRRVRFLMDRGLDEAAIAGQLKIHPYYLKETLKQAAQLSDPSGRCLLKALSECDQAFKTGQLGARLAFERFLVLSGSG